MIKYVGKEWLWKNKEKKTLRKQFGGWGSGGNIQEKTDLIVVDLSMTALKMYVKDCSLNG